MKCVVCSSSLTRWTVRTTVSMTAARLAQADTPLTRTPLRSRPRTSGRFPAAIAAWVQRRDDAERNAEMATNMRALRLYEREGADRIVIEDAPIPAPAIGDVLVQVDAASF